MMTQAELTAEMVNGKIEQYRGNITSIARDLKCARNTLYSFIENHPTCQVALKNARESMIDNVESSLYSKALEGEGWAVCFFLKTQAWKRGYIEHLPSPEEPPKPEEKLISVPADVLAPSFFSVYRDARDRRHMEYLLKGGRGSTKSSFTSLMLVCLLVNNPGIHALAMRQVANTLRDSVYSQIVWAIQILGLEDKFKCLTSPLEIEYLPTKQKVYFRGADKPEMVKSIKPVFGHIGILWFEELDQFHGPEEIRKIEQSVLRGGEEAWEFKTYNPPRTAANWVNKYVQIPKPNQLQHHSTYLDVPTEWLGQTFIDEGEFLKEVNPTAYNHEYLGQVVGTGGMVFENLQLRKISDNEIEQFDRVLHGLDFGYYPDPAAYVRCHYDAARLTLYIFNEYRAQKMSNRDLYDNLVRIGLGHDDLLIADSAEPKSVADFKDYGASCRGAEKGQESVKYSMKWLQSLRAIIIDNERAPYAAEEFLNYEYEQDKDSNFISAYPDRDNHFIDSVRYATNLIWRRKGQ
jgi:phage terminase large subunit